MAVGIGCCDGAFVDLFWEFKIYWFFGFKQKAHLFLNQINLKNSIKKVKKKYFYFEFKIGRFVTEIIHYCNRIRTFEH